MDQYDELLKMCPLCSLLPNGGRCGGCNELPCSRVNFVISPFEIRPQAALNNQLYREIIYCMPGNKGAPPSHTYTCAHTHTDAIPTTPITHP